MSCSAEVIHILKEGRKDGTSFVWNKESYTNDAILNLLSEMPVDELYSNTNRHLGLVEKIPLNKKSIELFTKMIHDLRVYTYKNPSSIFEYREIMDVFSNMVLHPDFDIKNLEKIEEEIVMYAISHYLSKIKTLSYPSQKIKEISSMFIKNQVSPYGKRTGVCLAMILLNYSSSEDDKLFALQQISSFNEKFAPDTFEKLIESYIVYSVDEENPQVFMENSTIQDMLSGIKKMDKKVFGEVFSGVLKENQQLWRERNSGYNKFRILNAVGKQNLKDWYNMKGYAEDQEIIDSYNLHYHVKSLS